MHIQPPGFSPILTFGQHSSKMEIPIIRDYQAFKVQVLEAEGPVLVKFSRPLCHWCEKVNSDVQRIAEAFQGKLKVIEVKMGTRPEPQSVDVIKNAYDLDRRGVPTFSIFSRGQEKDRLDINRRRL